MRTVGAWCGAGAAQVWGGPGQQGVGSMVYALQIAGLAKGCLRPRPRPPVSLGLTLTCGARGPGLVGLLTAPSTRSPRLAPAGGEGWGKG